MLSQTGASELVRALSDDTLHALFQGNTGVLEAALLVGSAGGKRLYIATTEAPDHALRYGASSESTVKILAKIRPDPRRDPVFSSRRHAPEHRLLNQETALFGRPEPERVDWFVAHGTEFFPVENPVRLKTALTQLGGFSSDAIGLLLEIGALGPSVKEP